MVITLKMFGRAHCFVKIGDLHNSFYEADKLLVVIHELCLLWENIHIKIKKTTVHFQKYLV